MADDRAQLLARLTTDPLHWALRDDLIDDLRVWIKYLLELEATMAIEVFLPSLWAYEDPLLDHDAEPMGAAAARRARLSQKQKNRHVIVRVAAVVFDVAALEPVPLLHVWCRRGSFKATGRVDQDCCLDYPVKMPSDRSGWLASDWRPLPRGVLRDIDCLVTLLPFNEGTTPPRPVFGCPAFTWRILCAIAAAAWTFSSLFGPNEEMFTKDAMEMFFETTLPWLMCCRRERSAAKRLRQASDFDEQPATKRRTSAPRPTTSPEIKSPVRASSPPIPSDSDSSSDTDSDAPPPPPRQRPSLSRQFKDISALTPAGDSSLTHRPRTLRPFPWRTAAAKAGRPPGGLM